MVLKFNESNAVPGKHFPEILRKRVRGTQNGIWNIVDLGYVDFIVFYGLGCGVVFLV